MLQVDYSYFGVAKSQAAFQNTSTHPHFILDTGDVEHGLDLLPQLEPHPVAQLHVLAQVALDDLQRQPAEWRSRGQQGTREV